jgi:hypothetical protein
MNGINGKNGNSLLSIIIVSYNTKRVTDDCLRSIYNAKWTSPYEIIVVDNNSQDGSVQMIKEKYPQVILIENNENKLFAKANNQGAAIAKGKYLLLLNSDTLVWEDNIQRMIDFFETQPDDVICIGPRVLNQDKSLQACGYPLPSIRERICLCFKLHKFFSPKLVEHVLNINGLTQDTSEVRTVGWVSGSCMMMDSSKYREVGGLNERIEFYGEEPEFGYRTWHQYRYRTVYYPIAEIIHLGGRSSEKQEDNATTRMIAHRRYALLQRETVGYSKAIWMSRVVILSILIKWIFHPNKDFFHKAYSYEKEVIQYLKMKKHEATTH